MDRYLIDMGARLAFTKNADFTGISRREGLFISTVMHQAVVEVNERGTEAAAATGVVISTTSVIIPDRVLEFTCDRPFMFIIHDNVSKLVLFMGKLVQP